MTFDYRHLKFAQAIYIIFKAKLIQMSKRIHPITWNYNIKMEVWRKPSDTSDRLVTWMMNSTDDEIAIPMP